MVILTGSLGPCERDARDTNLWTWTGPGAGAQAPLVHNLNPFKLPRRAFQAYTMCNTWMTLQISLLTDLIPPKWILNRWQFFPFPPQSRADGNCCLIPSLWLIWFKLRDACHGLVQRLRPSPSVPALSHFPFVSQSLLTLGVIIKTGQPPAPAREHK